MGRIDVKVDGTIAEIVVVGEIDISNLGDLSVPMTDLLRCPNSITELTLDLRQSTYMDSAALEIILRARNHLFLEGNSMKIMALRVSQPYKVMHTCRFDTIMDVRIEDLERDGPIPSAN